MMYTILLYEHLFRAMSHTCEKVVGFPIFVFILFREGEEEEDIQSKGILATR